MNGVFNRNQLSFGAYGGKLPLAKPQIPSGQSVLNGLGRTVGDSIHFAGRAPKRPPSPPPNHSDSEASSYEPSDSESDEGASGIASQGAAENGEASSRSTTSPPLPIGKMPKGKGSPKGPRKPPLKKSRLNNGGAEARVNPPKPAQKTPDSSVTLNASETRSQDSEGPNSLDDFIVPDIDAQAAAEGIQATRRLLRSHTRAAQNAAPQAQPTPSKTLPLQSQPVQADETTDDESSQPIARRRPRREAAPVQFDSEPSFSDESESEDDTQIEVDGDQLGKLLLMQLLGVKPKAKGSGSDDDEDSEGNGIKVTSFKKSPFGPNEEKLGFKRIAGMDSVKQNLSDLLIEPMKEPELYRAYGLGNSASGVLLYGPPGCGKTFFAKSAAEEAGANFLEIHPSVTGSKYIHQSSKLIGEAFNKAADMAQKTKKPTVMLIDELEAVAPQRTGDADNDHKNEEVAEFLNQLNTCAKKNVFVIGTTNYPQQLDPALIRSGRMNGKIYVGAPDQKSRQQLFQHFMAKRKPEIVDTANLDFGKLADKTKGYSNADIEEVVNQASRQAFKQRGKISGASFEQALKTVKPSINDGVARDYQRLMEKFQPEEMSVELKHFYGMI